ncbi:hypothetical protein [Streptomyces sp. 3N207]|uniref:hypothetical protein n=1 Tax=Streptomyces sp. 3N207 TaxID=3457417 RepID=UPI003FD342A7
MERTRKILAPLTVAACLPYLTLKVLWLSGSHIGIPEGSRLLDGGATLWIVNALTVAMDGAVILLVLTLTRPWGRRVPGPLLALPIWIACGLLGPIVVAFPLQTVYTVLTGDSAGGGGDDRADKLLDGWVWTLVYTGFLAQAITLSVLAVLYVRDRWGPLLRSPLRLRADGTQVVARWGLAAASLVALPALVAHTLWAAGSEAGLTAEHSGIAGRITDATFVLYVVIAFVGVGRLLPRGNRAGHSGARLWPTLTAAWVGSGVLACWGGWLLMGALSSGSLGENATATMLLAYACQALAGLLLAALGAQQLRRRARVPASRPVPGATVRPNA